jgi:hypothetical protein
MLKGRPAGGTRIRTLKEIQATSGLKLPAGTEGTLLETVVTGLQDESSDIFAARLDDGVVVQVLREDVEEVPESRGAPADNRRPLGGA